MAPAPAPEQCSEPARVPASQPEQLAPPRLPAPAVLVPLAPSQRVRWRDQEVARASPPRLPRALRPEAPRPTPVGWAESRSPPFPAAPLAPERSRHGIWRSASPLRSLQSRQLPPLPVSSSDGSALVQACYLLPMSDHCGSVRISPAALRSRPPRASQPAPLSAPRGRGWQAGRTGRAAPSPAPAWRRKPSSSLPRTPRSSAREAT